MRYAPQAECSQDDEPSPHRRARYVGRADEPGHVQWCQARERVVRPIPFRDPGQHGPVVRERDGPERTLPVDEVSLDRRHELEGLSGALVEYGDRVDPRIPLSEPRCVVRLFEQATGCLAVLSSEGVPPLVRASEPCRTTERKTYRSVV